MKCKQCNQEFEAKRSTAVYCSAKCRKLAFQSDGKVSVPQVSVPSPEQQALRSITGPNLQAELDVLNEADAIIADATEQQARNSRQGTEGKERKAH